MIIVDNALKKREKEGNPVKVGIIGAGFIGRGTVLTIEESIPGMKVSAISNRTIHTAAKAYEQAGVHEYVETRSQKELDKRVEDGAYTITDEPELLCHAKNLDVIIEATGAVEFGAQVILEAINNGIHVVSMNAEVDATIGPILKYEADKQGVIFTNTDGDQPGVLMNLYRFVDLIGYKPVLAGNIKGLQDHYRTPETQKAFAEKYNQKPRMVTSFADGTKISMEMAVVANATGFQCKKRGMHGPECTHVKEALDLFSEDDMMDGGMVDYILGAEPGPGVFVIGYNDNPILQEYANYLKMGDGPFYVFYVPYHLPHLEVPLTAARAVLFRDATIAPKGKPVCEVITQAKKDLKAGEMLDGLGGFTCYGSIENSKTARNENLLPMGLSQDCRLVNDVSKDEVIRIKDVQFPPERLCDKLWEKQLKIFEIT
ncbi:NAD(P)-dependent oxidoreductase [Rhodohalobacter sp. SW132]|uniref:NAD(P)H-dependent oxidoreductase n=1 Tax=Rhodohalobacter sp. SW132 TaxID=2293433 RepID=UPI000E267193|nr:Gfo/Idh/MocA family oxidoreductase [Rhodohalobacter sp. SW132]REL24186.1 NAD(P)-dependent oxidoreductase [Rhodohalobacter sp. SW132]